MWAKIFGKYWAFKNQFCFSYDTSQSLKYNSVPTVKCLILVFWFSIHTSAKESSVEIPQKIRDGSAFWPSNLTSGNLSKGTQNSNLKEHKHPYIHGSIMYNRQDIEAAPVSISRWVDKTTMGHREAAKMRRQRNMAQVKELNKTPEKELKEMEISYYQKYS